MATALLPDPTPSDHWWCADCGQWSRVDADLCPACADQYGLVLLVDMVLETDQLAYRLQEDHWRSWDRLSDADRNTTGDVAEVIYHGEAQDALTTWLSRREQQRYTTGDLHLAGGGARRCF
jgi:hypothetical protein